MLTPRPATLPDCYYMAERLRPADAAEVYAAAGVSPLSALVEGFETSDELVVGADEQNRPVLMGGVGAGDEPNAGCVWMLATTDIEKHKVSFLRGCRAWVEEWNKKYPVLFNCVDERNELHIKWLRWLGFTFIRRHPLWGYEKRPFIEFVRLHV